MARSSWNDAALREVFIQRLTEELKGELAAREESGDSNQPGDPAGQPVTEETPSEA